MESTVNYIRNILRKEGITGMDSVTHCIAFIVFRMMTPELCKRVGIDESLAFDNAINDEDGNEIGAQELYDKFYYRGNQELNFIGEFVNKLKFSNFKFKMEGIHNVESIIDKMKKFDITGLNTKYDIIGTIYELHLKSGTSKGAMRDLGQYYTHRLVIKYMIELCDPIVKKGIIDRIIDPTMGSGGFLTMSIKYLNEKYKDDNAIDWEKNKDNIIGFDIDDNVKNMALLNVFLEIGHLCKDTIVKQDTLHYDLMFPQTDKILDKADVILANEPMGLKNIVHADCCERIKELKIRGTKAEPLFLQLFMEALADGGRCAVIIPDGVLFNESNQHQGTRKHLIENFNLKKVVGLKDDNFFLNTGVKTSILFFAKDGTKTREVDFCEITINNDEIVETSVIKVTYKDIKANNYTLFVSKYNVENVEKIDGIEYKKLGDVCAFLSSKINSGAMDNNGSYNFYNGKAKNPDGTHSEFNFDFNEYLAIIKGGGAGQGKYGDQIGLGKTFYLNGKNAISNGLYVLTTKINTVNVKYLYHYLCQYKNNIMDLATYTTGLGNIKQENLKQFEIPIPTLQAQEAIVERLDLLSENNKTMERNIEQLKTVVEYYLNYNLKFAIKIKLSKLCAINPANFNSSDNYDFINYIDIGSVSNGVINTYEKLTDNYPSRAKRKIEKGDTIISTVRPNLKNYAYIYEDIKNGIVSTGFCVIRSSNKVLDKFIYYVVSMRSTTNYLTKNATGSSYPAVNSSIISDIDVPLPSREKQKEIVEYCDNLTDMIQKQEKQIILNKELMKQIMDNYLNSDKDTDKNETDENNDLDCDNDAKDNDKSTSSKTTSSKTTSSKTTSSKTTSSKTTSSKTTSSKTTSSKTTSNEKENNKKIVKKTKDDASISDNKSNQKCKKVLKTKKDGSDPDNKINKVKITKHVKNKTKKPLIETKKKAVKVVRNDPIVTTKIVVNRTTNETYDINTKHKSETKVR